MYSVAYGTTAQTSGDQLFYAYASMGLAMAVATIFSIGHLEMFLVLAAGVFLAGVLPGIISIKRS